MVRATDCGKACKVEVSRLTVKSSSHGVEFPAQWQLSKNQSSPSKRVVLSNKSPTSVFTGN